MPPTLFFPYFRSQHYLQILRKTAQLGSCLVALMTGDQCLIKDSMLVPRRMKKKNHNLTKSQNKTLFVISLGKKEKKEKKTKQNTSAVNLPALWLTATPEIRREMRNTGTSSPCKGWGCERRGSGKGKGNGFAACSTTIVCKLSVCINETIRLRC